MKVVVFGDLHLEGGGHLGEPDVDVGNTRMRDAEYVLQQIAAEPCDVLCFLGDAGRTATPKPTAYRIMQDALRASKAKAVLLLIGNHDYTGEVATCVHVMAEGLPRCRVYSDPVVTAPAGVQIGVLPWTPPSRLFAAAPHDPRRMNQLAAEALVSVTRGLGTKIDPEKPSLLLGHWLLSGGSLQSGSSVIEASEPVIDVQDLEVGPWDAIVFGHNHSREKLGERTYHCGPPLRGGFGEADLETGYMVIEWREPMVGEALSKGEKVADIVVPQRPTVRYVDTDDRALVTIDIDGGDWLAGKAAAIDGLRPRALQGAIVRLRVAATEDQAARLHESNSRQLRALVDYIRKAGAVKVVGPQLTVERPERRRSELTVDIDPRVALTTWLDAQDVDEGLLPLVESEAGRIMR